MKTIKNIGLVIALIGFFIFTASIFVSTNKVTQETFDSWASGKVKSEYFLEKAQKEIVGKELSTYALSSKMISIAKESDAFQKSQENIDWGKMIKVKWNKTSKDFVYPLVRASATGWVSNNQGLFFFLTFGLAIIGGIMTFGADYKLLGPAGIKNNGIFPRALGFLLCLRAISSHVYYIASKTYKV